MARFAEAMVDRYGPLGSYWCSLPSAAVLQDAVRPDHGMGGVERTRLPLLVEGSAGRHRVRCRCCARVRRHQACRPAAEVVLGSLTGRGASTTGGFLDQLYALGAADDFDTITINPYAKDVAGMIAFVRGARAIAARNGDAAEADTGRRSTAGRPAALPRACRRPNPVRPPCCMQAPAPCPLRTELNIRSIIQFQWHDVATTSTGMASLRRGGARQRHGQAVARRSDGGGRQPTRTAGAHPCAGMSSGPAGLGPGGPRSDADDTFSRTTANGWGSAETGGPYTFGSGTASSFSVAGGVGRLTVPTAGTTRSALLGSASARDVDVRISVSTDKAAAGVDGQMFAVLARRTAQDTEYRLRTRFNPDGSVGLSVVKALAGTETLLGTEVAVPGLAHVPGAFINMRVRVTGASPTSLQAKAWAVGDAEPSAWVLTCTDSETDLQTAGQLECGLICRRSA